MPGIGKSMLAKDIRKTEAKRIFGTVVMAEVIDMNDIQSVQDQIAADINLHLPCEFPIDKRAKILHNRLLVRMQDKEDLKQTKLERKDRKLLVILDNIWKVSNGRDWMNKVGIPFPNRIRPYTCKILVTSREKNACAQMVNKKENIVNLGLLTDEEATYLFKEQVGELDGDDKIALGERICRNCGGLPLQIKLVANLLKGQDLSMWKYIASELEKPMSRQNYMIDSVHAEIRPIIESSYRSLQGPCKMFFLLVCLFPKGVSIPIEELMRYGIGLGLFQDAEDVDEALIRAVMWAKDLVASSLLLRDENEQQFRSHVRIHEVVRASALLLAKRDGYRFLVDAIPKLTPIETCKDCTAISLTERDQDISRLKRLESNMLQTLILKGNESSELDSAFFQGMSFLKVLVLSNMTFNKSIPNSTQRVAHIRTLQLESCQLRDVSLIGELRELLVLSFRNSSVSELTDEINKLTQLQLLDLTSCQLRRISAGVIASFSQLRILYMLSCYSHFWGNSDGGDNGSASVKELSSLPNLTTLELQVARIEQLPNDDRIFTNKVSLDKFFIFVGTQEEASQELQQPKEVNRILCLESISLTSVLGHKCLFFLLPKTERLVLNKVRGLRNVVPYNNLVEGFMLSNLRELRLCDLEVLAYALPVHLVDRLRTVTVSRCKSLNFVFVKDKLNAYKQGEEELPLKKLQLTDLPLLQSILGEIDHHVPNNSSRSQALINKVTLPSLEILLVQKCATIGKIWDVPSSMGELYSSSFQNLKCVTISTVQGLESLLSPSMAKALRQLEDLSICDCKDMKEVISKEAEEVGSLSRTIKFPKLKHFLLSELSSLKYFYGGSYEIQFPVLKELKLNSLGSFEVFTWAENCRSFFHGKMSFPCLEELWTCQINSQQHKELWTVDEKESIDPVPQLRLLELHEGTTRPTDWSIFKRVRYVSIGELSWDYIFEAQDLASTKSSLHFEVLEIRDCKNLKTVIKSDPIEEESIEKSPSEIELPQLKRIAAISCAKMKSFCSSNAGKSGENDACVLRLPNLDKLSLEDCKNIRKFSSGPLKGSRSIKYEISMDGRTVMQGESNDINNTLKDPRVRGIFKIQVKYETG